MGHLDSCFPDQVRDRLGQERHGKRANTWVRPYVVGKPSPLSLRLM
jgi:hypothetical protein